MEEKSRQQQVFDWLLDNQDVLYSSDNTELYDKFKKSELPRNRLRSYKSRLKEKIEKGDIVLKKNDDELCESDKFFKKYHHLFFTIGKYIGIAFFVFLTLIFIKFLIKLFKE